MANISGDDNNNNLVGTLDADLIEGLGGNDVISGLAGNDTLDGGEGNDSLDGGTGRDLLLGEGGNDTIRGGDDDDGRFANTGLFGGEGNDSLLGEGGKDYLYGEAGNDTLDGGEGNDTLDGGTGIDSIIGGAGIDLADFDYSTETAALTIDYSDFNNGIIFNGSTIEEVEQVSWASGSGNDTIDISATTIRSTVTGGEGNDSLIGGAGRDLLLGEGGNDTIRGGDDDDGRFANTGLFGGEGNDSLLGEGGKDYLYGEAGNDTLDGGEGNDTLDGGTGIDIIIGGAGSDKFIFGDANWIAYDDRNPATNGASDYGLLLDFTSGEDIIQLQAPRANYRLEEIDANTNLFIDKPIGEPDELIAIIQGVIGLNLDSNDFEYILPLNTPPTTSDKTLTTDEDIDLVFAANDFNFNDVDSDDSLQAVRVDHLPVEGTLYLDINNNNVVDTEETLAQNDSVAISAINAGQFKFKPDADESGTPYTSFNFSVSDGIAFSTPSTINLNVTPVNDHPNIINGTPGRDVLEGTDDIDIITGDFGTDIITGNAGNDLFVYNNLRDAGDLITDFTLGEDRFDLTNLLTSLGISSNQIGFADISQGTAITLDAYSSGIFRNFILVQGEGVNSSTLDNPDNFIDWDFL